MKNVSFRKHMSENVQVDDLKSRWDLCANIDEVTIALPVKLTEVEAIFNSPKIFLREISLRFQGTETDPSKVIHAFNAGIITTLESIHLHM